MIKKISVKNLRAIKEQELELAPITVLYGENGSGKSSLINALAILKNIVLNPNQPVDAFFNLGFANFGGFEQVVFNHDRKMNIELCITSMVEDSRKATFKVILGKSSGELLLHLEAIQEPMPLPDNNKPSTPNIVKRAVNKQPSGQQPARVNKEVNSWELKLEMEVVFPYPLNQQKSSETFYQNSKFNITWNGVFAQVMSTTSSPESGKIARNLAELLNRPAEEIKQCEFVNLMRGFSKPTYSPVPLTPTVNTSDEVATIIATDPYLQDHISFYLEKIVNHSLRVYTPPGTATFWLKTMDKRTGISTELVNEGFGINQIVYLLAKALQKERSIVCVEEPEIHLHPKIIRNLVFALIEIVKDQQKMFVISTHSENLVSALLSAVAEHKIAPDEVACYLCRKERTESVFRRQQINENGQIEGGLISYMESEIADLKSILQIKGDDEKEGGKQ
ncbi:MAG: AAA family ATPase [Thermoplasmata archaeon]